MCPVQQWCNSGPNYSWAQLPAEYLTADHSWYLNIQPATRHVYACFAKIPGWWKYFNVCNKFFLQFIHSLLILKSLNPQNSFSAYCIISCNLINYHCLWVTSILLSKQKSDNKIIVSIPSLSVDHPCVRMSPDRSLKLFRIRQQATPLAAYMTRVLGHRE